MEENLRDRMFSANCHIRHDYERVGENKMSTDINFALYDLLRSLFKNRLLTISGDTSHASIESMIQQYADIDKDRDSQDYHENRFISFSLPERFQCLLETEEADSVIRGERELTLQLGYDRRCYDCGERIEMTICGTSVTYTTKTGTCKSNKVFEVEIDFPTGEIVFADWPANFSSLAREGLLPTKDYDVNLLIGRRQTTEGYAPYQIFHHSVGNTCPSWFYNPTTHEIQIGSSYDEDTDGCVVPNGFEKKGYFCTDLWWVTMIDKKYYDDKVALLANRSGEVETAKIEPGRYRFTAFARGDDDQSIFATAVRIGECSGKEPYSDNMIGKRLMTPEEYTRYRVFKFWGKTLTEAEVKSALYAGLDHIFNCIGNGIRNKGEFLSHISVEVDEQIPDVSGPGVPDGTNPARNPYPNFAERYSLLYTMDLADIPASWLEAALWFYQTSEQYFQDGAVNYSYAYPSSRKDYEKHFVDAFERRRKDGMTDEEWYADISKAYEEEFDGDIPAFLTRRWVKEKERILTFIANTIKKLDSELANRK